MQKLYILTCNYKKTITKLAGFVSHAQFQILLNLYRNKISLHKRFCRPLRFAVIITTLFLLPLSEKLAMNNNTGRDKSRNIIQLSGLVVTGDSLKPLPYTTIMIKNTNRGTTTDYYGFFFHSHTRA